MYVWPLLLFCTIFNAVELSSIYFSSITVFHDISKQIQHHARIGKVFARRHLAIAITSLLKVCNLSRNRGKKLVDKIITHCFIEWNNMI